MLTEQIKNKQEWENFVLSQPHALFVQSAHYGEFYETLGEKSWILGVYNNDGRIVAGSLVVSTHAKRGNFLYLPYGPLFSVELKDKTEATRLLIQYLKQLARKENYDFIRISPFLVDCESTRQLFKENGCIDAPMHILAETTCILDLAPTEDHILSQMEKNHRYLIRRCIQNKVVVKKLNSDEALAEFNMLHDATAKRHNFHRFSNDYIHKEFNAFASSNNAVVFHAYLSDGRLDSSAVIIFYGNMAAYRHGASLNLDKKTPTSYLLQWEALKESKRRGLMWYNFWGIIPRNAAHNHPFKGIAHFKKGFGGAERELLRCQDLPVSLQYWFNWIVETLRSIQRGFKKI